ncbi:hypothetical protein AgCh_012921 [Apium graveolens]
MGSSSSRLGSRHHRTPTRPKHSRRLLSALVCDGASSSHSSTLQDDVFDKMVNLIVEDIMKWKSGMLVVLSPSGSGKAPKMFLPPPKAVQERRAIWEYGDLLVSCGLIGEAVKVYEDHELWDTVIYCYCLLEKKASAVELIKKRLAERPRDLSVFSEVDNGSAIFTSLIPLKAKTAVDSGSKPLEFHELHEDDEQISPKKAFTSPINQQEIAVNLIITDYCIPGMTSYDLLKKIKESSFRDIPVVIIILTNRKYQFLLESGLTGSQDLRISGLRLSEDGYQNLSTGGLTVKEGS